MAVLQPVKAPFELVYSESVMVPLDHLTGATQFSRMQAAGEMAEEVSWLVDAAKTELGNRLGKVETLFWLLESCT